IKRDNKKAEQVAQKLVRTLRSALDDQGKLHTELLPSYVSEYNYQPPQEGRSVDALVRYHRVTADATALDVASLMTAFALENCFTPYGTLMERAGKHGHSINALVAGMLDLALLTNDKVLLDRARRVFDVGLPRFNASFGWSLQTLAAKDILNGCPDRGE